MMKSGCIPAGKQNRRKLMLVLMLERGAGRKAAGQRKKQTPS
jgi:hypothetical protein